MSYLENSTRDMPSDLILLDRSSYFAGTKVIILIQL